MNHVPNLGSYGYIAPAVPSASLGKRILRSPIFWLGLFLLFIFGALTYSSVKNKRKEEARLAKELAGQQGDQNNPPPYL